MTESTSTSVTKSRIAQTTLNKNDVSKDTTAIAIFCRQQYMELRSLVRQTERK